jgi:hypothetical protein
MTSKQDIIAALNIPALVQELIPSAKQSGSELVGLCPFHDDHNPSLSINPETGSFKCFACDAKGSIFDLYSKAHNLDFKGSFQALAARAGLGQPVKKPYQKQIVTGCYCYPDAENMAYWKERIEPGFNGRGKDFLFFNSPTVKPGRGYPTYISLKKGSAEREAMKGRNGRPRFYNESSIAGADTIFIPEGEQQVDLLMEGGFAAVTLDTGSKSKLTGEQISLLTGKHLVLLWDNDEPGRLFAEHIATTMQGKVPSIKVINLTPDIPKGDIINWAGLPGNGPGRLREIVQVSPEWEPVQSVDLEATGGGWPEIDPLPDSLPPVKPLDIRLIPKVFRAWISDISARMQVPPDYSFAAVIVAIGSVIGRGCGIRAKEFDDWLTIPNLFGCIVGRPSAMKTPSANEAFQPLDAMERDAKDAFEKANSDGDGFAEFILSTQQKVLKKDLEDTIKTRHKIDTSDVSAVQQADKAIADAKSKLLAAGTPNGDAPITRRRFQTQNATVQRLAELMVENPRGILTKRDELIGWWRTMDTPGREQDRGFHLESWDGKIPYATDTIGRGNTDVVANCQSVFGCMTPGSLSDYVFNTMQGGAGDDGLLQRFQVSVWPDALSTWEKVDREPDYVQRKRAHMVYERLAGDIPGTITDDTCPIPYLRFAPEGQEIFNQWRYQLETRLIGDHGLPSYLESHLGKYRSLMPTLALIFHLVDVADGSVEPGAVSRNAAIMAAGYCDYLESHAHRIYSSAVGASTESARELLRRIKKGELESGCTTRELCRKNWSKLGTPTQVETALTILEEHGYLKVVAKPTGGRSSSTIELNPTLKN